MLFTKNWKSQVLLPKPEFNLVVILENKGILEAKVVSYSYEIDLARVISLLSVGSYKEGFLISNLYNKMINKGIRVISLNNVVQAINILGGNQND